MVLGRRPKLSIVLALSVAAAAATIYVLTAAREVTWGDPPHYAAVAHSLGVARPPGYPLFTLLSAIAVRVPFGAPFFRLSVLSALFGAAAAGVVVLLAWELLAHVFDSDSSTSALVSRASAAALTGLIVAVSPSLWSQSTIPDVHALGALLAAATLALLVVWIRAGTMLSPLPVVTGPADPDAGAPALFMLWFVLGLSLSHVVSAALVLPSVLVGLFAGLRARPGAKAIGVSLVLLALGLSFYVYLPLRAASDPAVLAARPDTWRGVVEHIGRAPYVSSVLAVPIVEAALRFADLVRGIPREIHWSVLALSALGAWSLCRRRRILLGLLVLHAVLLFAHAASFRMDDASGFLIPAYVAIALVGAVGLVALVRFVPPRLEPGRIVLACVPVALISAVIVAQVSDLWEEQDRRPRRGASLHVERMLASLDRDAVLLAEADATIDPLTYALVAAGRRPDLDVLDVRGYAPHLESWHDDVDFPSEDEIAVYFGQINAPPCDPPARWVLPIREYAPLLVYMNATERPIFADAALAADIFADRVVPRGLLVEIDPAGFGAGVPAEPIFEEERWDDYLWGLAGDRVPRAEREAYAGVLAGYGELALARDALGEAVSAFETGRDLAPGVAEIHDRLGVAYLRAGRLDEALASFHAALREAPGLASPRYNIHLLFTELGELDQARADLIAAVRHDPRNAGYRLDLAALEERLGNLGAADQAYRNAERELPLAWTVKFAYGDFLSRQHRYSEAVAAYARAETLDPAVPRRADGGEQCFDDAERVVAALRRSVKLQPRNPGIKCDLAVMLRRSGQFAEALRLVDDALAILPGMLRGRVLKATLLGDLGRYAEAREHFHVAEEQGAGGPVFWAAWSDMESAAGDSVRAEQLRVRTE